MPLRNHHDLVPYGFFLFQPETNWESPKYIGFTQAIQEIKKHRLANPRFNLATDDTTIGRELEIYTEQRLRSMPGGEAWLSAGPSESPPASFPPRQRLRRPLAGNEPAAVQGNNPVKKVVAGISLIAEWLGDSFKSVEQPLADHRAATCARCPLNQKPTGAQVVTGAIADGLHLLLDAKNSMKLSTPHDNVLETCTACLCKNSLKVWVPIEHIKKHTSPEVLADFHESCWVREELKST